MRKLIGYACGATIAALVIGCGPGKEIPDVVSPTRDQTSIQPDPLGAVPKTSNPAAKAVVDRAVNSITQGKPELLAKARTTRMTAKGKFLLLPPNGMTPTERTVQAVWPDRARVVYVFQQGADRTRTFGLHSPFGWLTQAGEPYSAPPNPTVIAQVIIEDLLAEHWFALGLGFGNPKAVYFDPKSEKNEKGSTTTIKMSFPDQQFIYLMTTNDQSGLPVRFEYNPIEVGQRVRVRKVAVFSEHRETAGLMLPTVMDKSQNGQQIQTWNLESWEFPDKLDDSLFDPPTS